MDVREELEKVIGKRVIGYRVGSDGFDLVFDDGTELELYCIPIYIEERSVGDSDCTYGVVVAKYKWFRVSDAKVAEHIVDKLSTMIIDSTIVRLGDDVYVGIREDLLNDMKKICERNRDELVSQYICRELKEKQYVGEKNT